MDENGPPVVILHSDSDGDVSEEERISERVYNIHERHSATEYFVEEFHDLLAVDPDSNHERRVRIVRLLNHFRAYKRLILSNELYRIMLDELPYYCFRMQVPDSDLIGDLLRCIEDLENSSDAIFGFFVAALARNRTLSEEAVAERVSRGLPCRSYLQYFLYHATRNMLTVQGRKIPELLYEVETEPYYLELHFADPQCVLSVMQHGACFLDEGYNGSIHPAFSHSLEFLVFWGIVLKQWRDNTLELIVPPSQFHHEIRNMRDIFRIMLRMVSNPYQLTFRLTTLNSDAIDTIPSISTMIPFYDRLFPGMLLGRPRPSSLKNHCRYFIRKRLNETWELPEGIFTLYLPLTLQKYLNIEYD